jgi:formate dehydrogenase beta subunit
MHQVQGLHQCLSYNGDRMISLNIDGKDIKAEAQNTVLEAALGGGIYIPNLCYHPDLTPIGACRLCIVEIEGKRGFPASCVTNVEQDMVVRTNTPRLQELRRQIVWLLLSEHPQQLEQSSQLQKVVEWVGLKQMLKGFSPRTRGLGVISDEPLFIRDFDRCILCERCVRMCQQVRGAGTIGLLNRGINTIVGTSANLSMKDAGCKFCTACVEVCPSGALRDKDKFTEQQREKILLPCTNTCPAGIDAAGYVRLIAEGRFQDAIELIRQKVTFPYVLGFVCHHPCEEACRRGQVNEPIAIKALKRFVAAGDSGGWRRKIKVAPRTGKRVAIVGSGPAGLTAAWFLRKLGHSVTVFEALAQAGGMLRSGIPKYRLPRKVLNQEIKEIAALGVKIKLNTRIKSIDRLFRQGFRAVFLALGATEGIKMGIPGEGGPRVLDGISVLRGMNLGKKQDIAGKVAVVGGGNVAVDCARSALRIGAKKVTILYRRTQKEMPAYAEEVRQAQKEGVKIDFLIAPQRVFSQGNKLKVECIRMKLGQPDSSGRSRPIPIEGSEVTVTVDRLIVAIGQKSSLPPEFAALADKKGRINADSQNLSCARKGVFAGGDVVSGPASVIEAIQAGRVAAASIDKYLGGKGKIEQRFIPEEEEPACLGREEDFAYRKRARMPMLSLSKRRHNFAQVEGGLDKKQAKEEAQRCLRCQLRLEISPAPLPPKRAVKVKDIGFRRKDSC